MDVLSYLLSKKYTDSVVSQIANFEMHVLDTLPETGQCNIFYVIPASEINTHDLYIWAANKGTFEKVGTTKADLTNYYNKDEVNSLIANLDVDFTGYATEEWVRELIADIKLPETNLDDYAKKSELFSKDYNDLVNKPELFNGDYNSLINKPEIPKAYNDSELRNLINSKAASDHDHEEYSLVGHKHEEYLTEHQSLEGYAKTTDLFSKNYDELINKPEIPSIVGLATETYVQEEIRKINISETDLSNYYTKEEVDDLIESIEQPTVSLDGYATEKYVDDAIAAISEPVEEVKSTLTTAVLPKVSKVDEIVPVVETLKTTAATQEWVKEQNYTNETKVLELIENNASSKIGVDFVTDITIGHLEAGTEISKDMTIGQLLYKMLFAGTLPEEPEGVVEEIISKQLPMYSVNDDGEVTAEAFKIIHFTQEEAAQAPVESGFYQVTNDAGEVIESGYQDMQIVNDAMYYIVALPKSVDYNSNMVKMQVYDDEEQSWLESSKLSLTSDIDQVNERCNEAGVDISHIDTTQYTVWVYTENICTGSKLRYIIIE